MVSRFNNNPLALTNSGSNLAGQHPNPDGLKNRNPTRSITDSLRRRIKELQSASLNTSGRAILYLYHFYQFQ